MDKNGLNAIERDAIGEILNISLGSSATALSTLLGRKVTITIPRVLVEGRENFELDQVDPAIGVEVVYTEGLKGSNLMLMKRRDVKALVETLMGDISIPDEEFVINDVNKSAVCEVMNQMMGASATAMSEFLNRRVNISPPVTFDVRDERVFRERYFQGTEKMVVGHFTIQIQDKLESEFLYLMPIELCKELIKAFLPAGLRKQHEEEHEVEMQPKMDNNNQGDRMMTNEEIERMMQSGELQAAAQAAPAAPVPAPAPSEPVGASVPASSGTSENEKLLLEQLAQQQLMMSQLLAQMQQQNEKAQKEPKMIQTQPLSPNKLEDNGGNGQEQKENLDLIMGVPLEVTVEIGRTRHLIKDILEFTKGSLVVLDKLAGEQVDLLVNGQLVAKGDVVVVEDNFGVRITEIVEKPEVAVRK